MANQSYLYEAAQQKNRIMASITRKYNRLKKGINAATAMVRQRPRRVAAHISSRVGLLEKHYDIVILP